MAPRILGPTWTPTANDYSQVFGEQNPWHQDGAVPEAWAPPIERPLARFLWSRLQNNSPKRYQLVLGPRRVGKTVTLHQTVRRLIKEGVPKNRIWWLRLDHPLLMQIGLDSLVRAVIQFSGATHEQPVMLFLDELTYAKDWDLWLKTFYDENWPICLAGSSSSTAAIRHRRLESGIGRWDEQYLAPYLFGEYLDLVGHHRDVPITDRLAKTIDASIQEKTDVSGLSDLRRKFLLTGGFPELLIALNTQTPTTDEGWLLLQSQRALRNDAVERALYKDIPQAFGVESPMMLERMLYTLAGQVTGILSPNTICGGLDGLSQPTFDRYLGYLQRSFLVFTLTNYSGSESSKQRRGRKLFFVDGAVRNAALQRGLGPLGDAREMGLLMENLAAGHLHALSQQSQVRVYYWRDGEDEADLIYDHPEFPLAFEIAASSGHHRHGLRALMERHSKFRKRCYVVSPDALPQRAEDAADEIGSLPLDMLLLALSAQAAESLQNRLTPQPLSAPQSSDGQLNLFVHP